MQALCEDPPPCGLGFLGVLCKRTNAAPARWVIEATRSDERRVAQVHAQAAPACDTEEFGAGHQVLGHGLGIAQVSLQGRAAVEATTAAKPEQGLGDFAAGFHGVAGRYANLGALVDARRLACASRFPCIVDGRVEEGARGAQAGFFLADRHLDFLARSQWSGCWICGERRKGAQGGTCEPERNRAEAHAEHGETRESVERRIDLPGVEKGQGMLLRDENVIGAKVRAAGAAKTDDIPSFQQFDILASQEGIAGTAGLSGDHRADADPVGIPRPGPEGPCAADPEAAVAGLGRARGLEDAGESGPGGEAKISRRAFSESDESGSVEVMPMKTHQATEASPSASVSITRIASAGGASAPPTSLGAQSA